MLTPSQQAICDAFNAQDSRITARGAVLTEAEMGEDVDPARAYYRSNLRKTVFAMCCGAIDPMLLDCISQRVVQVAFNAGISVAESRQLEYQSAAEPGGEG